MPPFDKWGLLPGDLKGPRDNPVLVAPEPEAPEGPQPPVAVAGSRMLLPPEARRDSPPMPLRTDAAASLRGVTALLDAASGVENPGPVTTRAHPPGSSAPVTPRAPSVREAGASTKAMRLPHEAGCEEMARPWRSTSALPRALRKRQWTANDE